MEIGSEDLAIKPSININQKRTLDSNAPFVVTNFMGKGDKTNPITTNL